MSFRPIQHHKKFTVSNCEFSFANGLNFVLITPSYAFVMLQNTSVTLPKLPNLVIPTKDGIASQSRRHSLNSTHSHKPT